MPPKRKASGGGRRQSKAANSPPPLEGATFAITGTLSDTRANITKQINLLGGSVASSFTKAVTHLLCSEAEYTGRTAKVNKAEQLGVPIVSENYIEACKTEGKLVDPADYLLSKADGNDSSGSQQSPPVGGCAGATTSRAKAVSGGICVDPNAHLPGAVKLYEDEENGCYHALLVQQDRSKNMDKYYINQVIVNDDGDQFWAFQRWGRTGTVGPQKLTGPLASAEEAVKIFLAKFKEKTGNVWNKDGEAFTQKANKYHLVKQAGNNTDSSSRYIWQYYLSYPQDGKEPGWHNYDEDASNYVEDMYALYLDNPWLELRYVKSGEWTYLVDFPSLQQTNVEHPNRTVRDIRRLDKQSGEPAAGRGVLIAPVERDAMGEDYEEEEPKEEEQDDDGVDDDDDDSHRPTKKQKKTIVVPPLDRLIPSHISSDVKLVVDGTDVYDVMLNQTNVNANNNKFYLMQLLQSDSDGSNYYVWSRWGRVGVPGQNRLFGPSNEADAKKEFTKKFSDKTGNKWEDRDNFSPVKGKYALLEMRYDDEDDEQQDGSAIAGTGGSSPALSSSLSVEVQKLISIICDKEMMKEQMMSIGYDAKKLPLGKLSDSTIRKGYAVLERVTKALKGETDEKIDGLSSEFYTYIPHNFGFAKMSSFQLDSLDKVKEKMALLDSLSQIEAASAVLSKVEGSENPVDAHYRRLKCCMEPLPSNSQEYQTISQYLASTYEGQSNSLPKILEIFKIQRDGEEQRFCPFKTMHNRRLLWHGSRLTNWAGILSQGLRIAPPEAPVSGYNFGKGLYFADMFSKSSSYCYYNSQLPCALLALAEVSLGDMNELVDADYNANNLPQGKMSTKALGRRFPEPKGDTVLPDGVVVPLGKPTSSKKKGSQQLWFYHNEYIVYKEAQAKLRYLVQVKW